MLVDFVLLSVGGAHCGLNHSPATRYPASHGHYSRRWLRASHRWIVVQLTSVQPGSNLLLCFPCNFLVFISSSVCVCRFPGPVVVALSVFGVV